MKLVSVSKSHQGAVWEVTIPALFSVEKSGRIRSDFDGLFVLSIEKLYQRKAKSQPSGFLPRLGSIPLFGHYWDSVRKEQV